VLFKSFAGIDLGFDIEIGREMRWSGSVDVVAVAGADPSGGINLEDSRRRNASRVETRCRRPPAARSVMKIPVCPRLSSRFTRHHRLPPRENSLSLTGKRIEEREIVTAAWRRSARCPNLLVVVGARRSNIWVTRPRGVVYKAGLADVPPGRRPMPDKPTS